MDGRDFPEAYELALHKVRRLSWTSDPKVKKLIVFIGDAIPHAPSYIKPSIYWRDEVNLITQYGHSLSFLLLTIFLFYLFRFSVLFVSFLLFFSFLFFLYYVIINFHL